MPGVSTRPERSCILTINGGSSSLKFAVFDRADLKNRFLSGRIECVGRQDATWHAEDQAGSVQKPVDVADMAAAGALLVEELKARPGLDALAVVGHRIVHGGDTYHQPVVLDDTVIAELKRISAFDPDHLPGEIALIEAIRQSAPALLQTASFDTAFHHALPRVARILPIPRRYEAIGVRKYGFHGISYAYLMEELRNLDGPHAANGRLILAHLGSGASLAAVRDGQAVDTTMAFTPAAGIVMATRSGDLDPGLVRFLAHHEGMTADQFDRLINQDSGMLGVSETSGDVRDLLGRRDKDIRAAESIDLFCYSVTKGIGAFAAILGGLDILVFAGGIGENAPEIRRTICAGLGFLGIHLDPERNNAAPRCSRPTTRAFASG